MIRKILTCCLLITVLVPLAWSQQRAIRPVAGAVDPNIRQALVIGNSEYRHAGRLRNPVNDARAIGSTLQQLGFEVKTLLDADQLALIEPGHYRYTVTTIQVFQLQVKPVVSLNVKLEGQTLIMRAVDAQLEGLGLVDDFELTLESVLEASDTGLKGLATLGVQVSQPPLLRLIPRKVLESTGESILNGILLTIKGRVGRQLVSDFQQWCASSPSNLQGIDANAG